MLPAERQQPVQDRRVDRHVSRCEVVLGEWCEQPIRPALCGSLSRLEGPGLDLGDGLTCLGREFGHLWMQASSRTHTRNELTICHTYKRLRQ